MAKKNRTSFEDIGDSGYSANMFCNVVAAVVGTAVVGAAVQSDAARSAGNKQADAARAASAASLDATDKTNALNWQIYQQNMANNAPGMQAGQSALSALQNGLGLGRLRATQTGNVGAVPGSAAALAGTPTETFTNAQGQTVDKDGNVVTAPAQTQNYGATQAELDAAGNSIGAGSLTQSFSDKVKADGGFETDPSYQWRLAQGQKNLQASAAARGGLLTGQGLKDINDYAQGAASTEFAAANDRYNTNQSNLYNRLEGIAGIGQQSTADSNAAGTSAGQTIGNTTMSGVNSSNNYLTGGAAAQAASDIGQGNAWSSAINSASGNYLTMQYLNGKQSPWAQSGVRQTSDQIRLSDGSTFSN